MIPSFQVSADNLLSLLLYNEALCRVLYAAGSWAFIPMMIWELELEVPAWKAAVTRSL